jgi:hypothetical protein
MIHKTERVNSIDCDQEFLVPTPHSTLSLIEQENELFAADESTDKESKEFVEGYDVAVSNQSPYFPERREPEVFQDEDTMTKDYSLLTSPYINDTPCFPGTQEPNLLQDKCFQTKGDPRFTPPLPNKDSMKVDEPDQTVNAMITSSST